MITAIIAFLLGCLWTRTYYARIDKRTDWMDSWSWSHNKFYRWIHKINCEICPKRWYCERYKEEVKNGMELRNK